MLCDCIMLTLVQTCATNASAKGESNWRKLFANFNHNFVLMNRSTDIYHCSVFTRVAATTDVTWKLQETLLQEARRLKKFVACFFNCQMHINTVACLV